MSMCKLTTVKAARKSPGTCGKCGTAIEAGDGYRWWKGRYTGKRVRCMLSTCTPAPWERETNATRASFMQAEELVADAQNINTDQPSDISSKLSDALTIVEEVRDTLQERVDAWMGTGFENTQQYQSCEESISYFDDWLTSTQSVIDELEALEEVDIALPADEYETAMDELMEEVERIQGDIEDIPELDMGA